MQIKMIEIRDEATCIPAMAIKMLATNKVQDRFLWRCGYPRKDNQPTIVVMNLNDQKATSDPYEWKDRTMSNAHNYIYNNFDELVEGSVVDVRVILGEEKEPAIPEITMSADIDNRLTTMSLLIRDKTTGLPHGEMIAEGNPLPFGVYTLDGWVDGIRPIAGEISVGGERESAR